MTPEQEADLYALQRQAAELDLQAAELRLETAQADRRAATEHRPIPHAGSLRFDLAGYETKDAPHS